MSILNIQTVKSNSISLPVIPSYATNNGHMFYILTKDINHRTKIITALKENGFHAVFHYISQKNIMFSALSTKTQLSL